MNYWFWILCALVALAALLFIVLPLWRGSVRSNDVVRDRANLEILRDQIAEMDTDLHNGLLTQELYEQGKREIQARLLEEVKSTQQPARQPGSNRKLAIVLAFMLPMFSLPLYLYLGNHDATMEQVRADSSGLVSSDEGIEALASQLRRHPEDPDGWFLLANSYIAKQRYAEGADAYAQLVKLVPNEAQVWANYADVYAMAHGRTLQGPEVAGMLSNALALDPNNMSALALSGFAAMERADYAAAITNWQQLVVQFPAGSAEAQNFEGSIQRARELLSQQPGGKQQLAQLAAKKPAAKAPSNQAAAISGKVTLSPELRGKVNPDDIVFILARAAEGPKMPLAVLRKQVRDLPMEFTLDDTMAMQPQLKLSGFEQVVVVARVSKSGTPMAQSGDLEGKSATVKPGSKGLKITIDSVVP
ncbi:MAG TPA: c-type cytochrome biogenesis protein CcmI [Gallionella sp.]